jgi:YVTN family beta-propeller protein
MEGNKANSSRSRGRRATSPAAWLKRPRCVLALAALVLAAMIVAGLSGPQAPVSAQNTGNLTVSQSGPIALTHDDRFLWVVNPDNDTVSVFDVAGDANRKVTEIPVGREPAAIAITPDDRVVYVTNQVDGTLSVIDGTAHVARETITVGTEPHGCAFTPDGNKLYVANLSSDDISVIDTRVDPSPTQGTPRYGGQARFNVLLRTIPVASKPYALAITTSGSPERVYVTHFQAFLRPDGRPVDEKEGRDNGKEGRVSVISTASDTIIGTVVLNPMAETGFLADGSTLDRVPLGNGNQTPAGDANNRVTGAFPNLLESLAIKGDRIYVPSTASSPNGPFKFNVNVQSLMSVVDAATNQEVQDQTINMNFGVQFEPPGKRLFITTPIAIAFKRSANEGYVVSAATDRLVKLQLLADGTPTIGASRKSDDPGNIIRVPVGKNPRGLVLNSTDTRAYVMNLVSRDVSVVDIQTDSARLDTEIARLASSVLPAPGSLAAIILRGKELFNTGIGPAGTLQDALPPAGRMSDFGWGACYNCHPNGLTDGVTWMFPDGPRQTISMESTFPHPAPASSLLTRTGSPVSPGSAQRALNWSAVRDEVQDFELNIRGVSGGEGLITDGQGIFNLTPTATTGRSPDLDAIAAYIAFGIRAPIAPKTDVSTARGRTFFSQANCQLCHGGPNWTRSRLDFTPPPNANEVQAGQLVRFLNSVKTFNPDAFNEIRANQTANLVANGELGFTIPSLISVFASAPYLHDGSAQTLDDVLANVAHRSAGTGGVDTLLNPINRADIVQFLKTIDASTPPFP